MAAHLALLVGCATSSTTVDSVWRDSARTGALGKTLVFVLLPESHVAIPLENEWVRQLREKGVDAHATNAILRGKRPDQPEDLIGVVRAGAFRSVLLSQLVDVKRVERDIAAHQVAVVETKLYDAQTERAFWSARSDTFLVSSTGTGVSEPRMDVMREFVEKLIRAMIDSKVL